MEEEITQKNKEKQQQKWQMTEANNEFNQITLPTDNTNFEHLNYI